MLVISEDQTLRVAIFGGTFDPVHNGHLQVAREAVCNFGLDRVLFVPAANPPHKPGRQVAAYPDRLRMVELACEAEPNFEAADLEAGEEMSYSIRTVQKVLAQLREHDELMFVIGADAFAEIETWFRWQDLIQLVTFIVVSRPGHEYRVPTGANVRPLDGVSLPVSSSEIRTALSAGEKPASVPPRVLDYINARGLYLGK